MARLHACLLGVLAIHKGADWLTVLPVSELLAGCRLLCTAWQDMRRQYQQGAGCVRLHAGDVAVRAAGCFTGWCDKALGSVVLWSKSGLDAGACGNGRLLSTAT